MPRGKKDSNTPVFDFQVNPEKENLAKSTISIYKNRLNQITEFSSKQEGQDVIKNKEDILKNPTRVVELIHSASDDRKKRASYFASVFYAIGRQDLDKDPTALPLVRAFQKNYYTEDAYKKKMEELEARGQN